MERVFLFVCLVFFSVGQQTYLMALKQGSNMGLGFSETMVVKGATFSVFF